MSAAGRGGGGGPCYSHFPRPWRGQGCPVPTPRWHWAPSAATVRSKPCQAQAGTRGGASPGIMARENTDSTPYLCLGLAAWPQNPPFPQVHSLPPQHTQDSSSSNTSLWPELCYEHFSPSSPAIKPGGTGTAREMRFHSLSSQASC